MAWGYHLIIDCKGCNLDYITDRERIAEFVRLLISRINMTAHGDPQIEFLLPGTDNEGYSVLQMITTSNITAHFVNSTRAGYIDLFSCKQFDRTVVMYTINEFFNPDETFVTYLER